MDMMVTKPEMCRRILAKRFPKLKLPTAEFASQATSTLEVGNIPRVEDDVATTAEAPSAASVSKLTDLQTSTTNIAPLTESTPDSNRQESTNTTTNTDNQNNNL